jgi:hypothetical protein
MSRVEVLPGPERLPHTKRSEVEAAVKYDFLRLFGFPTDGNA